MRKKYLPIAVCCLALLLCNACGPSKPSGPPSITQAVLGTGATENYEIVNATSQFTPDTPKIYCTWKADGIQTSTAVRGSWIAEDVAGGTPPNYKIDDATVTLPANGSGTFSLSKPNTGFPVGKYRLEIYLGNNLAKTVTFTVKAN